MSTLANDQRYLTPRDVCALLSVSRATFYRLVHAAENPLPALKIGGQVRVRPDELEDWLNAPEDRAA